MSRKESQVSDFKKTAERLWNSIDYSSGAEHPINQLTGALIEAYNEGVAAALETKRDIAIALLKDIEINMHKQWIGLAEEKKVKPKE